MSEVVTDKNGTTQKVNWFSVIIEIFSNPQSAFAKIKSKPNWILPLIMMIVVSIGFLLSTPHLQIKAERDIIYKNTLIPEEAKDRAIEELENKSQTQRSIEAVAKGAIGVTLVYLIAALAFYVFGNFIYGGIAKYKEVFAMYAWGGLIGIIETAVKLPLMLQRGTLEVYTSPAVLMDADKSNTVLFQILNAFDIFTIWKLVVWSVGFSVVYQFSKGKSYTATITLYILYSVIAIGLTQLFQ